MLSKFLKTNRYILYLVFLAILAIGGYIYFIYYSDAVNKRKIK